MSHSDGEVALMDEATCPSDHTLARYVLGKLAGAEFVLVANHVEFCQRCDAIAESLETVPDALLDRLRTVSRNGAYMGEPELWRTLLELLSAGHSGNNCGCGSISTQFSEFRD